MSYERIPSFFLFEFTLQVPHRLHLQNIPFCFDGINTLLEFCIKQAVEAFGELKQDMLPLLHPPPMSLSFCPYYKHLILFSHFDFVMLYHFF